MFSSPGGTRFRSGSTIAAARRRPCQGSDKELPARRRTLPARRCRCRTVCRHRWTNCRHCWTVCRRCGTSCRCCPTICRTSCRCCRTICRSCRTSCRCCRREGAGVVVFAAVGPGAGDRTTIRSDCLPALHVLPATSAREGAGRRSRGHAHGGPAYGKLGNTRGCLPCHKCTAGRAWPCIFFCILLYLPETHLRNLHMRLAYIPETHLDGASRIF